MGILALSGTLDNGGSPATAVPGGGPRVEEESKRNNLPQVWNLREVQLEGLSSHRMVLFCLSFSSGRKRGT